MLLLLGFVSQYLYVMRSVLSYFTLGKVGNNIEACYITSPKLQRVLNPYQKKAKIDLAEIFVTQVIFQQRPSAINMDAPKLGV